MDVIKPDWVMVYASTFPHKINIVKAVLEDQQIASFEVNKKDSSYTFMGDIELYVNEKDSILAQFIIKTNDL